MRALAADVGGTKTLLAVVEPGAEGRPRVLARRRYASAEWEDPYRLLADFTAAEPAARGALAACLAVAGPVETTGTWQRARVTNLPWRLEGAAVARALGVPRARLVNDFEAVVHGLDALAPEGLETLQAGDPRPGAPRAVIGAGTGLGMAAAVPAADGWRVLPSEGGHGDFAPADAEQAALAEWLRPRLGRVTTEHLLSGPGLARILDFLRAREGTRPGPALAAALAAGDRAAAIGRAALAGEDPLAVRAVELFVRIYGARAGDLALLLLAHGGVYVAGGIAPRLAPFFRAGGFLEAFRAKPPMEPLLAAMPVHLVLDPEVGLLGAARLALALAAGG
ncbi:MAG TPA: glucokinase [Chromatiales bacterium]|nr:glucokinase [Chromatiales bacterium]